jgi:hypothetical protein
MFQLLSALLLASTVVASPAAREASAAAFVDPTTHGGSWLDNAGSGGGEPLNVSCSVTALSSLGESKFIYRRS